jgi:ribonuclease D
MRYQRLGKDAIRDLPLFLGLDKSAISIVDDETALLDAKKSLLGIDRLGFDTESKPTFIKGEVSQGPHLIQFSTLDHAYLIPTHFKLGLEFAIHILGCGNIEKVGFGLKDDKTLFRKKYNVELKNTFDLAMHLIPISQQKQQVGAKAAVAMILGARLSKSAQQSNWSNKQLTDQQIRYAANDAYSALYIRMKLKKEKLLD